MSLKQIVMVTLMLSASAICAGFRSPGNPTNQEAPGTPQTDGLQARIEFTKPEASDIVVPSTATGRLIVKFRDEVKARAVDGHTIVSLEAGDVRQANDIISRASLRVTPAITLTAEKISDIEERAAGCSGRAQPDLAGFMYLSGPLPNNQLLEVARSLNGCPEVEFVDWELNYVVAGGGGIGCALPGAGPCNECHAGSGCSDPICCEAVCELDTFCCGEEVYVLGRGSPSWDSLCVALAVEVCGIVAASPCNDRLAGDCHQVHAGRGCNVSDCCLVVCAIQPFCCETMWDGGCVQLAAEMCGAPNPSAPTPSFTDAQGYLRPEGYLANFGYLPPHIVTGIGLDHCSLSPTPLRFLSFGGEGWNLDSLWQFGSLLQSLGTPGPNLTRGRSVNVGVIEHTALVDWQDTTRTHEDLRGKVIAEPHQTLVLDINEPDNSQLNGNHGTACLGIIGAKDDGTPGHSPTALALNGDERGCVGIAPEASLYFFPMVSVEEGGRLLNAIASALSVFGPGDVLSLSVTPGPGTGGQTLASSQANWTMFRLAADLGVTCCIAAGDNCTNIDGVAQFQSNDSGCVIVGACNPGFPYTMLRTSNFCLTCQGANRIHVSAWGAAVATLGYGDLAFIGGNHYRKYTNRFLGTSAACAQIAGLIADLQGLSKQFYGIPLMPAQMRSLVAAAGTLQGGTEPPPGPCGPRPCAGCCCPLGGPKKRITIGPNGICYPNPVGDAAAVISSSVFGGNPLIDDISIIRGDYIYGNKFSIKSLDDNFFVLRTQYTHQDFVPNLPGPASLVHYVGTGQVADVLVTAHSVNSTGNMILTTSVQTPTLALPSSVVFLVVEMFDWTQNTWVQISLSRFVSGPIKVVTYDYPVPQAQRFIGSAPDRKVLIRLYMINTSSAAPPGVSHPEGDESPFIVRIDMVRLREVGGFGPPDILPPPPP